MKPNTKVSWQIAENLPRGSGTTIGPVDEDGKILVAVDHLFGEQNFGFSQVIRCPASWLKDETPAPPETSAPAPELPVS